MVRVDARKPRLGRQFYLEQVLPHLDLDLEARYPLMRLTDAPGFHALAERSILMLVALTGSGKSTTLARLRRRGGQGQDVIATRREVADWIAIPTAQSFAGEALRAVPERVERFRYTRTFAELVPGGMASAFSWLRVADRYAGLIISEGIRGPREIAFALRNHPRWTIVELSVHPLTRLRRLSARRERFDRAHDGSRGETVENANFSFLPAEMQVEARALLAAGEITERALAIVAAEAANYGLYAFDEGASYAQYHRLAVDGWGPDEVADAVDEIIRVSQYANN